ncbi:GNAT family N-acetyltransferase [Geodermatophilus poikilotrophus]|uniref:GNAT family N-acetyltransferase n=1 Tax=Geodermatophilus poikilotrophus TaxID=1333667 RepID=UPI001FE214A3|nr:GNAT family N-acetyltransferase [Geodermatophilus poikilotrophus]
MTTRPLTADDGELLRTATLANVNWTGEPRFTARHVERTPELRHYCEFRPERGDLGFVAETRGLAVGVVWALFLPGDDPGYGFVADGVPELSLSVWSGHRGRGIGGGLLSQALEEARRRGLTRVGLSVEAGNPSVRLYRSAGFSPVPGAADGTMAVDL